MMERARVKEAENVMVVLWWMLAYEPDELLFGLQESTVVLGSLWLSSRCMIEEEGGEDER